MHSADQGKYHDKLKRKQVSAVPAGNQNKVKIEGRFLVESFDAVWEVSVWALPCQLVTCFSLYWGKVWSGLIKRVNKTKWWNTFLLCFFCFFILLNHSTCFKSHVQSTNVRKEGKQKWLLVCVIRVQILQSNLMCDCTLLPREGKGLSIKWKKWLVIS